MGSGFRLFDRGAEPRGARALALASLFVAGLVGAGLAGPARAQSPTEVMCAPYEHEWSRVSDSGDVAAMNRVIGRINPACGDLLARARARRNQLAGSGRREAAEQRALEAAQARAAQAEAAARAAREGQSEVIAGPALSPTLSFITHSINDQGAVSYSVHGRDPSTNETWTDQDVVQASRVRATPDDCRIDFHWHTTRDGALIADNDIWFSLKYVIQVRALTSEDNQALVDAGAGHPNWTSQITPPFYVVKITRSDKAEHVFLFRDLDLANRVATAFKHAVQLCGGSVSEF